MVHFDLSPAKEISKLIGWFQGCYKEESANSHCCQGYIPITIKFRHNQVITIGLFVYDSFRSLTQFSTE